MGTSYWRGLSGSDSYRGRDRQRDKLETAHHNKDEQCRKWCGLRVNQAEDRKGVSPQNHGGEQESKADAETDA